MVGWIFRDLKFLSVQPPPRHKHTNQNARIRIIAYISCVNVYVLRTFTDAPFLFNGRTCPHLFHSFCAHTSTQQFGMGRRDQGKKDKKPADDATQSSIIPSTSELTLPCHLFRNYLASRPAMIIYFSEYLVFTN